MSFAARARRMAGITTICAIALVPVHAFSQEISESHLKAARDLVAAIHVTDRFDNILPGAGAAIKTDLLRNSPDKEDLINKIVDEKTLALVGRRGDLEREAAMVFARAFTEDELKTISSFYTEPAGKKFIESGPRATAEVFKAAEIWQRGITRDLAQSVTEALQAQAPKAPAPAAPANPDDAPASETAPAGGN